MTTEIERYEALSLEAFAELPDEEIAAVMLAYTGDRDRVMRAKPKARRTAYRRTTQASRAPSAHEAAS